MAPSVVGSLNEKDDKAKKAKQPIVIWPEWTEQDIAQEKWVRLPPPSCTMLTANLSIFEPPFCEDYNSWLIVRAKCL